MSHRPSLIAPVLVLLAGCADTDPETTAFTDLAGDEVSTRCVGCDWGPPILNTHGLNGLELSELDTTGALHDGWRLESVELSQGRDSVYVIDPVWVEDGFLYGVDQYGDLHSGHEFVGSVWTVSLSIKPEQPELGTTPWYMTITELIEEADGRTRYTFANGPARFSEEAFNCQRDEETDEYTVVLFTNLHVDTVTGTHEERPDTIYFGCTSGAVGKAAMWGYAPHFAGDDAHQAATRAVRADYCGDGNPWTQTGTALQITDAWDYNQFPNSGAATEAMWTTEGAACLMIPRRPEYEHDTVTCPGVGLLPFCESEGDDLDAWPSALLWTKVW